MSSDPIHKALAELVAWVELNTPYMSQVRTDSNVYRLVRNAKAALAATVAQPERRSDGMPTSADERRLRRLLWAYISMAHTYYDDGEATGQEHGISIDFMREPVDDIDAKLRALGVARLECAAPVAQPAICKTVTFALSDADAEELLGKGFAKYSDALAMVQEAFDMGVSAALAAPIVAQPTPLTDDQLLDRVERALERHVYGHAARRIPADNTDSDIVLYDLRTRRAVERAHGIGSNFPTHPASRNPAKDLRP